MKNSKLSRINEALSGIIDLVYASLLWILCSLPLFTLGASTTALYYTVAKNIRHNRGSLGSTFFHGFRSNFRISTLIWLLFLLYIAVFSADSYALSLMGFERGSILHTLSPLFLLPPLFLYPWIFAYISRFEDTIRGSIRFTLWLMLRYPLKSMLLAAELTVSLLIAWLIPQLLPLLPAPVCLLMSITIEPVFKTMQPAETDHSTDDWYNE